MSTGKPNRKASTKAQTATAAEPAEPKPEADPGTGPASEATATIEPETVKEPETETAPPAAAPSADIAQDDASTEETLPSERMIGELRKELSDQFPHAEFKELLEQMQMQLHRMPKHTRDNPKRRVWFHVEVPVQTIAFIEAWMPHLWPSRRSKN